MGGPCHGQNPYQLYTKPIFKEMVHNSMPKRRIGGEYQDPHKVGPQGVELSLEILASP
jgi:hypothetical protein